MKLYLVQHGLATSKEEDDQQPLTGEGLAEVRRIAGYAASLGSIKPRRILRSGKLRAKQTAEMFAEYLNPRAGVEEVDDLKAMAEPSIRAERLASETDDMMLVGHLPHLSRLSSLLICGDLGRDIVRFRNAGIVCLERSDTGVWQLLWKLDPELIG
ncbi:MAG: phosphohistidine phosphatase SixA [Candidatus Zixiibacteriota bacterium]|nr:MAG: phosphohistidine phosphatase SixA [candidate division Zixibacteria bacterium]